jgi:hypothetical protein
LGDISKIKNPALTTTSTTIMFDFLFDDSSDDECDDLFKDSSHDHPTASTTLVDLP